MVKPISQPKKKGKGRRLGKTAEQQDEIVYFAWEQSLQGHSQREIALQVFDKFELEVVPSHETVRLWLHAYGNVKTEKMAKLREDYVRTTIDRARLLIREYMPILVADSLNVRRMIAGNEIIDEGTLKEKFEAGKMILKTEDHVRKVLGVGLSDKGNGDDQGNRESTATFILNLIQNNYGNGKESVGQASLSAGNPTLEMLDAQVTPLPETQK